MEEKPQNNSQNFKFTTKQKAFCDEYMSNGRNACQAYLSVFQHVRYSTAQTEGPALLKKPHIAAHIALLENDIAKANQIRREDQIKKIVELYETTESENVKLKCLDMLNKIAGLYIEKPAVNVSTGGDIKIDFGGYQFDKQNSIEQSDAQDINYIDLTAQGAEGGLNEDQENDEDSKSINS